MSQQISSGALDITLKASGDLSSKQYYFIKLDGDGKAEDSGANNVTIGILQNAPDAEDKAARVRAGGTSKLVMSEACNEGDPITSTSTGKGEVADADKEFFGAIALEAAGADDDIIEVLITHGYYAS